MPVDPLLREVMLVFLTEVQETSPRLTRDILSLEQSRVGGEAITGPFESLARGLHTLKGSAGTLGLTQLAALAHAMEDVVAPLRKSLTPLPSQVADRLLSSLDLFLSRLKAEVAEGAEPLPDLAAAIVALAPTGQGLPSSLPSTRSEGNAAGVPADASSPAVPTQTDEKPASTGGGSLEEGTWRVSATQVTALFREVERLRELRLRLEERQREAQQAVSAIGGLAMFSETAEARSILMGSRRALQMDADEAGEIVTALEDGLKQITTLPVRTILDPLHRMTRDLCRKLGRRARLSVVGAEVSLDRGILEALRAPLTHLIRNAIDHGIETPDVRRSRGKHEEGAVVVRVEQQGNMVFLEFSDDGNGIDLARVREVATARHLLPKEELESMEPAQLQQLIFRSGFSTRADISDTSGRGVGLDVVRTQVQALHGHIETQSTPGQGTRFVITLPTDLGAAPLLLIRCGEHQLGIPMAALERTLPASLAATQIGHGQMTVEHEDRTLPLLDLASLLGIRQVQPPRAGQPLLVVQTQGQRAAVAVDDVSGQEDLVVRPLPSEVRSSAAFQGVSSLARGELVMVLRPEWVVSVERRSSVMAAGGRRALVVDDSLTARAMHRAMLEAGGYTVHVVSDARTALGQLRRAAYDVMVCDIRMEGMDGLELTSKLRASDETRTLPIILVSALDPETERERARSAGADAFISKKDCVAGRLLAEVSSVVARRRGDA